MEHLRDHDERAVRGAIVAGIHAMREREPTRTGFEYRAIVHQVAYKLLAPEVARDASSSWAASQISRPPDSTNAREYHDNAKLLAAMWALVGEGLVFPRMSNYGRDGYPHAIETLVLTARGERVLSGGPEHVLHPGFIERFKVRAPTATAEVINRMEDAVSCAERSLFRASVVMVGLAGEETLRVAHAALVHLGHIKQPAGSQAKARDLLSEIQTAIASAFSKDERHRLSMALVALEGVRTMRNSASHPEPLTTEGDEVEELLASAARQLPVLWSVVVQPAVAGGFVVP